MDDFGPFPNCRRCGHPVYWHNRTQTLRAKKWSRTACDSYNGAFELKTACECKVFAADNLDIIEQEAILKGII